MTPESPIADLLARLNERATEEYERGIDAAVDGHIEMRDAASRRMRRVTEAIVVINEELQRSELEKGA